FEEEKQNEFQKIFNEAYSDRAVEKLRPELYSVYRFCARVDRAAGLAYLMENEGYKFDDQIINAFHDAVRQEVEREEELL
ncbi:MAG: hypothetical protein SVU32_03515, partial [Candidatus Nanohaloarchaea archaeon]|nr:hypothetical protein [Candidatus Nanohaloarchaea archaeon]